MIDFDMPIKDDAGDDLVGEKIKEVAFSNEDIMAQLIEYFFDFGAYDIENACTTLGANAEKMVEVIEAKGEWSFDDIMKEFK